MKAYNVAYGTDVLVTDKDITIAPNSSPVRTGDRITIHITDGMYCNGVNKDGDRIYVAAWTEVEPLN